MLKEENNQAQISVLEFPLCVRKRKGMYLPKIDYMVFEITDNGTDEGLAGYAHNIYYSYSDKIHTVMDDGRGIPVIPHPDPKFKGLSQAEVAYTNLHAGGKFNINDNGYKNTKTAGLNGVGGSCVNALSKWLELEVYCNHKIHKCRFEKGIITEHMREIGTYDENISGTKVSYQIDEEIWFDEEFDFKGIAKRLQQLAFLNSNLSYHVDIDDDSFKIKESYHYEEGLKDYLKALTKDKILLMDEFAKNVSINNIDIEFAFTFVDKKYDETINSFVNNIPTNDGGDHLIGMRIGICKAINDYAINNKLIKENTKLEMTDILEGIVGIIHVRVEEPNFDGQGKSRIKMSEVRKAVKSSIEEEFSNYLDYNPDKAKILIEKAINAQKIRQKIMSTKEALRQGKNILEGKADKLAECRSKNPEECEIWLAEGDSAGGSLKKGRDSNIQAILPVFGKLLNVLKASLTDVIKSPKIIAIIKSIKCGFKEEYDISKLRYHKIIIGSDADIDGKHIAILFIVFFFVFYPEIIEKGYLYLSGPPLYKISYGKNKIRYAYSDFEKDQILLELKGEKTKVSRFKG